MEGILPEVRWSAKERLIREMRRCSNAKQKLRDLIIVNLLNGRTVVATVDALQVGRSTVYDVARRFRERGEAGLIDGREENGDRKLDERYLATLSEVVQSSPQDHDWRRPTWTRELLVQTLRQETGVTINVATMSIALKMIGARRGRPKPIVNCPLVETGPKPAFTATLPTSGATPRRRGGRLRRRSRHPSEPEDRPGLDGDGTTERSSDTGKESEALSGRSAGRADGRSDLGGGGAEEKYPLYLPAVGTPAAVSRRENRSCHSGQLQHPFDGTSRRQLGHSGGETNPMTLSAALLSRSQQDRTDLEGSA